MNTKKILYIIGLVLAILSLVISTYPLLTVAVILGFIGALINE